MLRIIQPEADSLFFSYNYYEDYPLFISYNSVVKSTIDSTIYMTNNNWGYDLNFEFSGKFIYVRNNAFLHSHLINYYLNFDLINIEKNRVKVKFHTLSANQKLKNLVYLEGCLDFRLKNGNWLLLNKSLVEYY
jgi:hypothetical protein